MVLVTGYRDTSDIWSIDQLNLTDPRTMVHALDRGIHPGVRL